MEAVLKLLHEEVFEEDFALFALVDLEGEESFGVGAVADPVGGGDAVDPGFHDLAVGLDGDPQAARNLLLG